MMLSFVFPKLDNNFKHIACLGNILYFGHVVHGTAHSHHVLLDSMTKLVPLLAYWGKNNVSSQSGCAFG
jgi:hypothetical protein